MATSTDPQPEPRPSYFSEVTLSDEGSRPDDAAEGVLLHRRVPSRAGLPLTEAVGRLVERLGKAEVRLHRLEVAGGVVAGVLLGVVGLALAEAVLLVVLWRGL
jgi:hypothetical protein